jgi:hypothetical protein
MNLANVALCLKISPHRVQPKVYRIRCLTCGVTGRESVPQIGTNYVLAEAKSQVKAHAEAHLEFALEDHRERMTARPSMTLAQAKKGYVV